MYYCETCRKEKKWPAVVSKYGTVDGICDVCGTDTECYEVTETLFTYLKSTSFQEDADRLFASLKAQE